MFLLMLCFFILAKSGVCRLIFFFPFSLAIFFAPFSLLQTKSNSHLNTDTYFIDACCLPPHAPLPHQITFRKSILILKFTRTQYDIYVLIHYGYGKRRAKRRGKKNIASYVIYVMLLQRPDEEGWWWNAYHGKSHLLLLLFWEIVAQNSYS